MEKVLRDKSGIAAQCLVPGSSEFLYASSSKLASFKRELNMRCRVFLCLCVCFWEGDRVGGRMS